MKKAVIVTPFDNYSYPVRIKYVEKYLSEHGYEVLILSSDFDHRNKCEYSAQRENLVLIHVPTYKKNLSFSRIHSHKVFAQKVLKKLEGLSPILIYCSAPPNYLFKYVSKYKIKHPDIKLIYELGDLWPETLPLRDIIKRITNPILKIWSGIRDNNVKYADEIIYECQMFSDLVSKAHPSKCGNIVYLCKEDYYKGNFQLCESEDDILRFAYVGSINNIIDVDLIIDFISALQKKRNVELVIIGDGENKHRLIRLCNCSGVNYRDYGIVYDDEDKHKILSSCQFGLNIMKETVAVGATMKSLEYFHEGMVLINNIKGDTYKIVLDYKCGMNISRNNINTITDIISKLTEDEINQMRINSRHTYEKFFSEIAMRYSFDRLDLFHEK